MASRPEAPSADIGARGGEAAARSDRELVAALLERQPGAWEDLVDRFGPLITAVVRRTLAGRGNSGRTALVDDIVENTFAALLDQDCHLLRTYRSEHTLSTYLGVIARTQVHRHLRVKNPRPDLPEGVEDLLEDSGIIAPDEAASRAEVLAAVRQALADLPERDRTVLRLFYFESRDYREIADLLNVKVNTVGSLLSRARTELKGRLEAYQ